MPTHPIQMRRAAVERDERGTANRLLRALPQAVFDRLQLHLEPVALTRRETLYEVDAPIDDLYFIDRGLVSLVKTMRDGRTVEIGAIGIEGVEGSGVLLGIPTTILESVVQIPGKAFRIAHSHFSDEVAKSAEAHHLMRRYAHFSSLAVAQTAACNRLHSIEERCCRWLLTAHDSACSDTFPLTHEFLAMMLGVQRASVSITASTLQKAGFIAYTRGRLTIIDRAGLQSSACECYDTIRTELDQVFRTRIQPASPPRRHGIGREERPDRVVGWAEGTPA